MTYDIIENYPYQMIYWKMHVFMYRIAQIEITTKPHDRYAFDSSYRGNPLAKTEQNMFLEVMVYKT